MAELSHKTTKKHLFLILSAVCFFILDRILKSLALNSIKFDIIPKIAKFELSLNGRLAMSLGPQNSLIIAILIVIITAVISLFLVFFLIKKQLAIAYPLTFIAFGAISNILDRLIIGQVVDYISVPLTVFNLADISILAGTIILISKINKKITPNAHGKKRNHQ